MKLLHVMADSDPRSGGVVEGVTRLTDELAAMGHEQDWFTLDHAEEPWLAATPVRVHAMGRRRDASETVVAKVCNWARRSPLAARWLLAHVGDYDAVVVHGLWNYSTRCARLALCDGDVPYVVFPHGMLDPWFARAHRAKHAAKRLLWRINEGPLLRSARAVAFTTERERELAREFWRPWHLVEAVVGFGTAAPPRRKPALDAAFSRKAPDLEGRPYLLFLGRLHPKKGCELLIDAFAELAGNCEYDLVIAGTGEPGYETTLKRRAAATLVSDRTHFPGMLEGAAKWGALHGCEALVLPSFQENFGIVVAEALGCGRPVIVSNEVNIADRVADAGAGLVCPPDTHALTEALRTYLALDVSARVQMGVAAGRLFSSEMDMAVPAEKLERLLRQDHQ